MVKTSVKFQKKRNTCITAGGQDGRTEGRNDGKPKDYVPPLFFEKAGDNNAKYDDCLFQVIFDVFLCNTLALLKLD